ncbi:MAG: hypothetical protein ABI589_05900 [Burkholderiales bacterium]
MSYVLHVWEAPVPATLEEADKLHETLSRQGGGQNPKFIEFAKRLTQRFPDVDEEGDEEGEGEGDPMVWTDSPATGHTDAAVYGIGVQTEYLVDTVVPFVVATARALGLVLFDMQAAEAHLPDGRVLTLPGRDPARVEPAPARQSEVLDRKDLVTIIQGVLTPLLAAHGFKSLKRWSDTYSPYKRRFKDCEQRLFFGIDRAGPYAWERPIDALRFAASAQKLLDSD